MGDLGQVLWLHLQRGVPVHEGYGDMLPFGSSPLILGWNHSDPELCVLPAPAGAARYPSVSLASLRSWRKEENLDDAAQGGQGQGGSRDQVWLLAPEWRAAYLGRRPGETVVLQHGSPRHRVNVTIWGRRRLDATCSGHLVPQAMGTWDTHNIVGDGTNGRPDGRWWWTLGTGCGKRAQGQVWAHRRGLMAIGGGHLGQAQGHGQVWAHRRALML